MPLREFTSKHFLGRSREIGILQDIASQAGSGDADSIILFGKKGIGKTELLKHLYNHLFNNQNDAIPFFYTIKPAFASVASFSEDYISVFILQSLAFLKKDPSLINAGFHSLDDLRSIADKPARDKFTFTALANSTVWYLREIQLSSQRNWYPSKMEIPTDFVEVSIANNISKLRKYPPGIAPEGIYVFLRGH